MALGRPEITKGFLLTTVYCLLSTAPIAVAAQSEYDFSADATPRRFTFPTARLAREPLRGLAPNSPPHALHLAIQFCTRPRFSDRRRIRHVRNHRRQETRDKDRASRP